ncbi:hypothetical protein EI94DRAFT_1757861 [Lactarius quietus]|nr:hypothetical protein EI94DRAFT_1757861 [Lactarius quietus]
MPLVLLSKSEIENGTFSSHDGDPAIQQLLSFYPGHGDNAHTLARIDHGNLDFHTPEVDDDRFLTDDDSADDEQMVQLALKHPSKFSESVTIEIRYVCTYYVSTPSWAVSGASEPENSGSQTSGVSQGIVWPTSCPLLQPQPGLVPTAMTPVVATELADYHATSNSDLSQSAWPVDTDLVFPSGSTKLLLLNQRPMVRAIIQEGIENLRAALMFTDAFPGLCSMLTLVKDSLFTAAMHHMPGAMEMLNRLTRDQEYLLKITPLPHARICLFQSEIKERCSTTIRGAFEMFTSPLDVINHVHKQLANYTYTFPRATIVNAPNGLVMRTRPYRNDHIITVIKDMFFIGGATSFARCFKYLFPTYQGHHGEELKVPTPMLYAAIYKWRNGAHKVAEFSANAYLDVYNGHINTLKHIWENREGAFHLMMADIYEKASTITTGNETGPGVAICNVPGHSEYLT